MSDPAPESSLPYPPLHKGTKFVVLSDWDGTITTHDSNDYMTDNLGMGKAGRRQINLDTLNGELGFRDGFRKLLKSVSDNGHTFEECKEILKQNIKLDSGFLVFYRWCKANNIPVIIVSSGMTPIIRAVLSNLVGDEDAKDIDIISNDVIIHPDGKWDIKYRHPTSHYGHDKSQAILPYKALPDPPILFFFGDGVSDMSAAKHADVLFVKTKGDENDLATYCQRESIKHIIFKNFGDVLPIVESIVKGEKSVKEILG